MIRYQNKNEIIPKKNSKDNLEVEPSCGFDNNLNNIPSSEKYNNDRKSNLLRGYLILNNGKIKTNRIKKSINLSENFDEDGKNYWKINNKYTNQIFSQKENHKKLNDINQLFSPNYTNRNRYKSQFDKNNNNNEYLKIINAQNDIINILSSISQVKKNNSINGTNINSSSIKENSHEGETSYFRKINQIKRPELKQLFNNSSDIQNKSCLNELTKNSQTKLNVVRNGRIECIWQSKKFDKRFSIPIRNTFREFKSIELLNNQKNINFFYEKFHNNPFKFKRKNQKFILPKGKSLQRANHIDKRNLSNLRNLNLPDDANQMSNRLKSLLIRDNNDSNYWSKLEI